VLAEDRQSGIALERRAAGEELVERATERVHTAGRAGGAASHRHIAGVKAVSPSRHHEFNLSNRRGRRLVSQRPPEFALFLLSQR
jgi:hypothetical protein